MRDTIDGSTETDAGAGGIIRKNSSWRSLPPVASRKPRWPESRWPMASTPIKSVAGCASAVLRADAALTHAHGDGTGLRAGANGARDAGIARYPDAACGSAAIKIDQLVQASGIVPPGYVTGCDDPGRCLWLSVEPLDMRAGNGTSWRGWFRPAAQPHHAHLFANRRGTPDES